MSNPIDPQTIAAQLRSRLDDIDSELAALNQILSQPLDMDFSEQANEIEEQDAVDAIRAARAAEAAEISATLDRIARGDHGICIQCGNNISPQRLTALPTASRCIDCAQ